jgi:hypothetical protein
MDSTLAIEVPLLLGISSTLRVFLWKHKTHASHIARAVVVLWVLSRLLNFVPIQWLGPLVANLNRPFLIKVSIMRHAKLCDSLYAVPFIYTGLVIATTYYFVVENLRVTILPLDAVYAICISVPDIAFIYKHSKIAFSLNVVRTVYMVSVINEIDKSIMRAYVKCC